MSPDTIKPLSIFAPAKINLYLHITGKLDSGYHTLDSLISFADIGDDICIEPAQSLSLEINGPYGSAFKGKDLSSEPESTNLVIKAVRATAQLAQKTPALKVTLTKNLPLGAGIGGGSADAAAIIWGLLQYWALPKSLKGLDDLMLSLGADVPVCFACQSAYVSGIGETITPAHDIPEQPIVLIYPGKPCHTGKIFSLYNEDYIAPHPHKDPPDLDDIMKNTRNSLTKTAIQTVPSIQNVLENLQTQEGCMLVRMSGSGSSCFGLFKDRAAADNAAENIASTNPDWWVKSGWLGRTQRY